jgi:replicative DNA helicase
MSDSLPELYSRPSEEALVGAVLINPSAYYTVSNLLRPDDFFIHRLRFVWEAISDLVENQSPVDFLTVTEALDRQGRLAEIGGPAYLTGLINATPSSLNAEAYARLISDHSGRRRLLGAADQIARLSYQTDLAFDTALAEAEKVIFTISQQRSGSNLRPLAEAISAVYDQAVEMAERQDEMLGIPTGFTDLDKLLNGLQSSDLVLIAGRPGMGKTSLLLSLLHTAAQKYQKHVAVFTLEMSGDQLAQRLLSQTSGIDSQRLRSGRMSADEWALFTETAEALSQLPVFLDDTPALTPFQLRSACRRLAMETGLDMVIVDYLQLMSGGSRFENRVQEVGMISRQLKVLAKELNVPVIAAAQLSRAVEQRADKKPTLADLRESGNLEMDADIVILLHRPQPGLNLVTLEVAKHRKGPVGSVDLVYRPELTRFENAVTIDLNQVRIE